MKYYSSSSASEGRKRKKIKGREEKAEMGTGWFLSHATCGSGRLVTSHQPSPIQSMHYFHNYSLSVNSLNSSDIQYYSIHSPVPIPRLVMFLGSQGTRWQPDSNFKRLITGHRAPCNSTCA
jgi:hypothetical protein